jgi:hypothetical protein
LGVKNLDRLAIIAYFFVLLLGLIGASVGLGHGLRRLAWGRPLGFGYAQVLYSGLAGAVALASLAALWWTRGVTIQLLTVVIGLFFLYEARRNKSKPVQEVKTDFFPARWWEYWPLLAGAGLVYAFCAWGFVRPGAYVPFSIPESSATFNHDQVYSARIAYFSLVSGQESDVFLLQLLDPAYNGVKPYHYLELWLTNLVAVVGGQNQLPVLCLVAYPFCFWLALVGILALWEAAGRRVTAGAFLASLVFFFIGGFDFSFYQSIPFLSQLSSFEFPLLSGLPKLGQVYAFLLAFALLARQRQAMLALLTLLLLGANHVVLFPSVGLAAGMGAIWALVSGFGPRARAGRAVGYVLAVGLGVAAFYHFFDVSTVGREGTSTKEVAGLLTGLATSSTLRTQFNIVAGSLVQMGVFYGPYLLVAALFGWAAWRELRGWLAEAVFWVVLMGSAAAAWAIFYQQFNSIQLFYNLAVPAANVLVFRLAVWLAGQANDWRAWAGGLLIATSAAWLFDRSYEDYPPNRLPVYYSNDYLRQVDVYVKKQPGLWQAGASLKHPEIFFDTFQKYITVYPNGTYLAYLGNGGAAAVSLNDAEIPLADHPRDRARDQQALRMGLFYRWVAKEKAAGTFRDVPTSQAAFVRHYQLKFLIVSKGVEVPATLRPMVTEEFIDALSGERFLVLDPKK